MELVILIVATGSDAALLEAVLVVADAGVETQNPEGTAKAERYRGVIKNLHRVIEVRNA